MDFQKDHHKHRHDQERMQGLATAHVAYPVNQFMHQPWRVKRRCRLKNGCYLTPLFIKLGHAVFMRFVLPTVPLILAAIGQQIPMNLQDVVFVERNVLPGAKQQLHHLRITRHLLLVTRGERLHLNPGQQHLHSLI